MSNYTYAYENQIKETQNNIYNLISVIIHIGSIEEGHYYLLIKDRKTEIWYEFNDIEIEVFNFINLNIETFGNKDNNIN